MSDQQPPSDSMSNEPPTWDAPAAPPAAPAWEEPTAAPAPPAWDAPPAAPAWDSPAPAADSTWAAPQPPPATPGYDQPGYAQPGYDQGYAQPAYGQAAYAQASYPQQQGYQTYPGVDQKSKMAAGLLGILLGAFGVHNFYLGYTGKAIAQLLITVLSCGLLAIVSSVWGIIEGVMILTGSIAVDARGVPLKE